MKKLIKNLTISRKLELGFGTILIFQILTAAMSLYGINKINSQVDLYSDYTLPNNTMVWTMNRDLVSVKLDILEAFVSENNQYVQEDLNQADEDSQQVKETLDKYASNQRNTDRDEEIKKLYELSEQSSSIRKEIGELLKSTSQSNKDKARTLYFNEYSPIYDEEMEILTKFSATAEERAVQQEKEANSVSKFSLVILIACSAASIAMTVMVTILITRSIIAPVNEIKDAYSEISKGNLRAEIKYQSSDELGQMVKLIRSSNEMQTVIINDVIEKFTNIAEGDLRIKIDIDYPGDFATLKEVIINTASSINQTMSSINIAAEQVNTGSEQVSAGSQALAAGATEQASSVEELSAAVTVIAQQAEENSVNVKEATKYVEEAGTEVSAGHEHMEQLTNAMAEISSSSNQIAGITKTIEDIAFQTNILALNAAIEAARAGSAGKGFAVVADEVRNLAAKSADASKRTEELIQNSVATVAKGSEIMEETAQVLKNVGDNTRKVAEKFINIEKASIAQTDAIEQIKVGIDQVSEVIQTNAATAEENSATSEEMSAQAASLREEVGRFKLNTETVVEAL